jgi:adenylate cyclase
MPPAVASFSTRNERGEPVPVSILSELKRRHVFRVAALYLIAAWLLLQVAELLFGLLELPSWTGKFILGLLVLGFPPVVLLSWIYELTPDGLKRQHEVDRVGSVKPETGRKLNAAIGVLAVLAILVVVADRLLPRTAPSGVESTAAPTHSPAAPPATPAPDRSIAVLPFVDMSATRDQEYFTDGISEELLNLLAKIPELKVIGRSSSFQFKGKNKDLRVIGEKLDVTHLLEGSVRKSGEHIRLAVQLIRADDGSHVWSETYDRQLDDIFAVQEEIATAVVRALKLTLLGNSLRSPGRTQDTEAHSLYLQARFFADRRGPGDFGKGIDLYERALARDPNFAMAWVELAAALSNYSQMLSGGEMAALLRRSRVAARRAVEVDPQLPDGYAAMAFDSMVIDWDFKTATDLLARARELDSGNLRALHISADLASANGNFEEAIVQQRQVVTREPLVALNFFNLGIVLRNAGRLAEAEQALRRALELSPGGGNFHASLAGVQVLQGKAVGALATLENESEEVWKTVVLPIVLHALGRDAESAQALRVIEDNYAADAAFQIAEAYAFRGETEKAIAWLERAYRQRDPGLTEIKGNPWLKSVEGDARYREIVRKVGLPV